MPMFNPRPLLEALGSLILAGLLFACEGEKQTQAQAPGASTSPPPARANSEPPSGPPNTPTASNVSISAEVLKACNIPDSDAYFAFDSSKLTSFDHAALDAVAVCFTTGTMKGRNLHLVGHADPRGTPDYNITLGQSRADSVAGYFASQGLPRSAVTTTSRGVMDATGRDETGWAHDRRVDVLLGN